MVDPKSKRQKLYEKLVSDQAFSGTAEDFDKKFSDETRVSKLYKGLSEQKAFNGTEQEFREKFFSDLLKKKLPSFAQQMAQRLDQPSQGSGQSSSKADALTADKNSEVSERVADAFKSSYEGKYGKPKQSFRILPELKPELEKAAQERATAIRDIYNKKLQMSLDSLQNTVTDPIEFDKQAQKLYADQNKLMQDQMEIEYSKIGADFEKRSVKKAPYKGGVITGQGKVVDATIEALRGAGKQIYNVFANTLPAALKAADSEALPVLDVTNSEDGSLRFKFDDRATFGSIGFDIEMQNSILDLQRRINSDEPLTDIAVAVRHPDVKKALDETILSVKNNRNKDVIKSTFAAMLNRELSRRKRANLQEIQSQNQDSEELLEDVPLTWKEASASGNFSGYVGGAVGQGLGTSIASVPLGVAPGARALEFTETYTKGLEAKAQRKSQLYGTEVTPDMLLSSNDDADVIETAALMGNINAGLETVGTIFGVGKLAKGIFVKKVSEQIVKKAMGRKVFDALSGSLVSAAVGGGTEALQSANTLAGTKKLAGADYGDVYSNLFIAATNKVLGRKVSEGQSIDDAAASITEEEIDEIFEAGLQGVIAEGGLGTIGEASTFIKSASPIYIDKVTGQALTREAAEEKVAAGKKDEVQIYNDPALEQKINPLAEEQQDVTDTNVGDIEQQPDPKTIAKQKIDALVESKDLAWENEGKRVKVLTEKGGEQLKSIMEEAKRSQFAKRENITSNIVNEKPVSDKDNLQDAVNSETSSARPAENIPLLDQAGLAEVEKTEADPERKRVATVLGKALSTLSATKPIKVALYNGEQEGNAILKSLGAEETADFNGFFNREQGVIGVDMSSGNSVTGFHEAFHPIIDMVKESNPEVFTKLSQEASQAKLELADGTIVSYGDYMKGDKEEALVEFLADYADGKFDQFNKPSIVQQVKDFIDKILAALGLKSSDFNIDLSKTKNLKAFADQMAEAISKGKTINFDSKIKGKASKKGTSTQRKGERKLNRTAKRIAFDRATEYKELQADIVKNPDAYSYDPQKFSDIDQYLEAQTDADLFNMISINNSMGVLAGLKLLRRYNAKGIDTRPVFKKLREIGTSVGQLLRQFGELKNSTAEGIVQVVLDNLESLNVTLTEEQTKTLEGLAKEHIEAVNEKESKRVEFLENPSSKSEEALKKAENDLAKSFEELNTFIGKVTPNGLDTIIATVLQGNLLTVKSIVVNVISNLIQQGPRQIELAAGDFATYMVNKGWRNGMVNPLGMYFGATLNGIHQSGLGVGRAARDVVKGRGAEYNSTLEVRRNLKPLQALQQIFTKAGRRSLPVNAKGNTPMAVYLEKAIEGTSGWPAEAMFRMLYLGDKPFKDGARIAGAYRLFAEKGGGNSAEFRRFIANLSSDDKLKLDEYADEATFSNQRTLSKFADNFVNMVHKNIDALAEKTNSEGFRHFVKVFGKVIAKANTPFVRVPSNLLQYLIELAVPVVPLYGSIHYARKGDTRKSAQLFTRAGLGIAMTYMADMLYDAGAILASGDDDDDNERQLKHEVGRPNGINIDAMSRFFSGTLDPNEKFKKGDRVVDFTKFGLFGMFMAYRAEFNESVQQELKKSRKELDLHTKALEEFNSILGASLEMSFMQGTYNMFKALEKGGFQDYGAELMNTLTAVAIPNNVSVYTRSQAPYILRADDKEALKQFMEKQSVKIHPDIKDNIAGVYPIVGMFGDFAVQNPKRGTFGDVNPLVQQFFDITNGKEIDDQLALEVFNLSKRVGDIPVSIPSARVKLIDKTYTLNEQDFLYLQMVAGKYKRIALQMLVADPAWKEMPDAAKFGVINEINEAANKEAREFIVGTIYEGISTGRIVLDEKMGTYSYTKPSEFDFDFANRIVNSEE